MNKYIDADKLKEVVDRVYNQYVYDYGLSAAGSNMKWIYDAIDSLQQEQPEVDLEKEIDDYIGSHFSEAHDGVLLSDASRMELAITDIAPMARHFYKLGLKTRKEE